MFISIAGFGDDPTGSEIGRSVLTDTDKSGLGMSHASSGFIINMHRIEYHMLCGLIRGHKIGSSILRVTINVNSNDSYLVMRCQSI